MWVLNKKCFFFLFNNPVFSGWFSMMEMWKVTQKKRNEDEWLAKMRERRERYDKIYNRWDVINEIVFEYRFERVKIKYNKKATWWMSFLYQSNSCFSMSSNLYLSMVNEVIIWYQKKNTIDTIVKKHINYVRLFVEVSF